MAAHVQAINQRFQAKRTAWRALANHYKKLRGLHLRELFADDPVRGERMAAEGAGIYLDYSKNRVTDQTIKLLIQLAEESGLQARIDAMFAGRRSTLLKTGRPCMWRFALQKAHPYSSMARMWCRGSTLYSTE